MSETATVETPVDPSSSAETSTPTEPNISCNRCGTLTTWNPYCPSCGAYLEFSGTPAWHPEEQLSTIPTTPAESDATSADTADASTIEPGTEMAEKSDDDHDPDEASGGETAHHRHFDIHHPFSSLAHLTEHASDEVEHDAHDEFDAEKSRLKEDLHPGDRAVKPWWASWGEHDLVDPTPDEVEDPAPAAKVMAASGIAPDPESNDGTVFTSRRVIPAPEIVEPSAELPGLPTEETQRTRAMGNEDLDADGETCTRCDLKNPAGRQYCDWCGTPLPNVVLGPENDSYNPYGLKSSGKVEVSTAPRRSYALKMTLLIVLLCALAWSIWFFFFGPKSEETITAAKVGIQKFTEWLAPSVGANTPITNVTASSSLAGTSPLALRSLSSRDFWASSTMTLYGAGSQITFTFDKDYEIDRVAIYPGIQNQTFDVNALATPKTLTIDVGNGKEVPAHLNQVESNSDYEQIVNIPVVMTDKVTITIDEVYPPRYPDPSGNNIGEVAISAIAFLQVPSATTVNPLAVTPSASSSASSSASPSASSSASASASAKPKNSASASATPKPSPTPSPSN